MSTAVHDRNEVTAAAKLDNPAAVFVCGSTALNAADRSGSAAGTSTSGDGSV